MRLGTCRPTASSLRTPGITETSEATFKTLLPRLLRARYGAAFRAILTFLLYVPLALLYISCLYTALGLGYLASHPNLLVTAAFDLLDAVPNCANFVAESMRHQLKLELGLRLGGPRVSPASLPYVLHTRIPAKRITVGQARALPPPLHRRGWDGVARRILCPASEPTGSPHLRQPSRSCSSECDKRATYQCNQSRLRVT